MRTYVICKAFTGTPRFYIGIQSVIVTYIALRWYAELNWRIHTFYCSVNLTNQRIYILHSPIIKTHRVFFTVFFNISLILLFIKTFILSRVEVVVKLYPVNIIIFRNFLYTVTNQLLCSFIWRIKKNSVIGFYTYFGILYVRIVVWKFFRSFIWTDSVWINPCMNFQIVFFAYITHNLQCVILRIFTLRTRENMWPWKIAWLI